MDKPNYNKNRRFDKREKKEKMQMKKCPFCGCEMKPKGASDCAGGLSFKCKNKKCGRRVWTRKQALPPIPIVPSSRLDHYHQRRR